ncbi:uncharacterized protein A1O5_02061 [Cladophialophora psammophila CBS 110553]|uniref:hydroxymethylglutaryl-CoA lyase n=1 Tax=Cladophialophora psammophila CBS 110553 TaxID=1182543 RepID=W9XDH8_9EURO|nr:uncharacterized protein A1O5_02061 [Cladophialophora psammophila CBS 110553]EXJ75365.1 hypothetical protein A1O5_02061 [Cladophialophora psammophila CBS 110553]
MKQCWRLITTRNFSVTSPQPSSAVRILEVGPRDGLQNIKTSVPTSIKVDLIRKLAATGLRNIEATSFVSPKWVPQLADGADVMAQISNLRKEGLNVPVLAPNPKGLTNAIKAGAEEVVVFASATEGFSKRNQNCTVDEALDGAQQVVEQAKGQGLRVRGVVSCIFADPYTGRTSPSEVLHVVKRFLNMGCYEVGLGDTVGVGTPKDTQILLELLLKHVSPNLLAGHFHDTYGQAIANVSRAYDMGIRSFDSSVAGLGGCPYARGAKGNLATEDLIYTLEKSGVSTGVDLDQLTSVGDWISQQIKVPNSSRAGTALLAKRTSTSVPVGQTQPLVPRRVWTTMESNMNYTVARSRNGVKITLTRSKNGNAMTRPMLEGLTATFRSLAQDRTVFHIVLDAEGKYFCTGMDLSSDTEKSETQGQGSYYSVVADLFSAIDSVPQTTVAVINGPCYGGGVGLGMVCDIRLASGRSRWTLSEIKLGLAPAIISKYLAREWGTSFLREAMLTGREILPAELLRIGAIHAISDDSGDGLNTMLDVTLEQLSRAAPGAGAKCKQLLKLAWTNAGGAQQDALIQKLFNEMVAAGSEGEYGMAQFQKRVKDVDWAEYWASKVSL